MTGYSSLFHTFNPCPNGLKVRIADGTLSSVIGFGSIAISKSLTLKSVLLVPNLTCNLLSVSKLLKDQNCVAKFTSFDCNFQDLSSGKTIGNAKECAGLYLFEDSKNSSQSNAFVSQANIDHNKKDFISNNDSAIMLWHYRLGHPNFVYLEKLFPTLFNNKSPKNFQCEVCQLSKHT